MAILPWRCDGRHSISGSLNSLVMVEVWSGDCEIGIFRRYDSSRGKKKPEMIYISTQSTSFTALIGWDQLLEVGAGHVAEVSVDSVFSVSSV